MSKVDPDGYSIGAAARLSGVSREKIRIWERRYGAVEPYRDRANHRLYSRDDVERLRLIQELAGRGHAVSAVANLDLATLRSRAADALPLTGSGDLPAHILAITEDPGLTTPLRALGVAEVTTVATAAEAAAWLNLHAADLILADHPTLLGQDTAGIARLQRRAPGTPMLVRYRFAARAVLTQLESLGIRVSKAPLQPHDLILGAPPPRGPAAAGGAGAGPAGPDDAVPARRYDAATLERLAGLTGAVQCECPNHLADLVRDLQAFEDYSVDCQSESPDDAALHREIYRVVARARALVEDALGIVADAEGIGT